MGELAMRLWSNDKIRFLMVGAVNTVFGYGLFAGIFALWGQTVTYMGALVLAHIIASSLAFILYRRVVFEVDGGVIKDFIRFQSVYAGAFIANLLLLPALVAVAGINVYIAQAFAVVVVSVSSYVGHRYFSFRRDDVQ